MYPGFIAVEVRSTLQFYFLLYCTAFPVKQLGRIQPCIVKEGPPELKNLFSHLASASNVSHLHNGLVLVSI